MDRLIFRLATPDDDPDIQDLYKASFGHELSAARWRWFSYQCPNGLNRTSVIEDPDTGRLAGSYSLLPIRLRLNDSEVKASLCTNVNAQFQTTRDVGCLPVSDNMLLNTNANLPHRFLWECQIRRPIPDT